MVDWQWAMRVERAIKPKRWVRASVGTPSTTPPEPAASLSPYRLNSRQSWNQKSAYSVQSQILLCTQRNQSAFQTSMTPSSNLDEQTVDHLKQQNRTTVRSISGSIAHTERRSYI